MSVTKFMNHHRQLRLLTRIILCLALIVTMPIPAFAQTTPGAGENVARSGPRKHLTNIVFAGLAGAVLGLSTLSFYGRPQERLSNIAVGFAIGIIIGTGYSTYKAAAEPKDFYGQAKAVQPELWAMEMPDRDSSEFVFKPSLTFEF